MSSASPPADELTAPVRESASAPALTPRARRLGIHGPRQSGKTSYLTVLQHYRKTGDAGIVLRDEGTLRYLEELWNRYLAAGTPVPRTAGLPTELQLDLQAAGQTWEVHTRDYPGERVQRPMHDEALAWLESCDAILVFLDTTSSEAELAERLNEVDVLLAALRLLSHDGHTIARPLALVLTKWDTHGPIDTDHPEREEERALAFLNARPSFRQLYHALLQAGRPDRVRVFPVSAFGENRDVRLPPAHGPRTPLNLHAPFVWAMQQGDDCHAEGARRRAEEKLQGRRPDLRGALAEYDRLVIEKGINKGPVYESLVEPERARLKKLLARRRRLRFLALSPLLILLAGSVLMFLDTREYRQAQAALEDHEKPPGEVATTSRRYVESWNPVGKLLRRDADVSARLKESFVEREAAEYAALEQFRRENPDDEWAAARHDRARDFRQHWPGSERDAVVRAWETQDRDKSENHGRKVEHRRAYEGLTARVETLAASDDQDRIVEEYTQFLSRWPEGEFSAVVKEKQSSALVSRQHNGWKKVVRAEEQTPHAHLDLIDRAKPFLVSPIPALREQAHKMVERHKREWDREDYEAVRRACHEVRDTEELKAAERKVRDYLQTEFPPRRRKPEAQKWLTWLEGLQKGRDFHVVVRRIEIPPGSKLRDLYGKEEVRVVLNLAGTEHQTEWVKGKGTIEFGEKLGPFKGEWGKEQTLEVTALEYDDVSGNDTASGGKKDATFPLWWANGVFVVKCAKNKDVKVYLECPDLEAPRLPDYGDQ